MDPITIAMLATGAISSIGNWISGRKQKKEGEAYLQKSQQMNRSLGAPPKMEMPKSIQDYIDLSRTMARQEMPGETQMRQDIAQTNAATLSSAKQAGSGFDTMAAVLSAGQNRMNALRQMGIAAAQYRAGQQQQYAQAVASQAPYEQEMFNVNQWLPWQMRKNEAMGYQNMGLQMKYQGQDMGAAALTQGANMMNTAMWGQQMNPNSGYNQWWNNRPVQGQNMNLAGQALSDPSVYTNLMPW